MNKFESKQDLIDVLLASCNIPFYFDSGSPFYKYKNALYIDGGLFEIIPPIKESVKICVFPGRTLFRTDIAINPYTVTDFPFSMPQMLPWILVPPKKENAFLLYKSGKNAAYDWQEENDEKSEKKQNSILRLMHHWKRIKFL